MDNRAPSGGRIFSKTQKATRSATSERVFRKMVVSAVIILTFLSILLGTGLGLRVSYPLLVPLVSAGMATVTLIGFARGEDAWWFAVAAIVVATGLQFGYLAGVLALVVYPQECDLRVAKLGATVPIPLLRRNDPRLPPSR